MDTNCTSFSKEEQHIIFLTKLLVSSFGISLNVLAVIVLLFLKSCYLLIFRIVLYILIASLFELGAQLLALFPIVNEDDYNKVRVGWIPACWTLGFLDQATVWMVQLSTFWLVLYIINLIIGKKRLEEAVLSRRELVGIGLCFLFPFVFNWVPFTNDYYGFSGSWCWIKITRDACNDLNINTGLTYILVLYFVPLSSLVLVNTIICMTIFVIWCKTRSNMKEVVFVIIYPLVYNTLFSVVTISRIQSTLHRRNERTEAYPMWIAHAVAEPARNIFLAFLVILHSVFQCTRRATEQEVQQEDMHQDNENKQFLGSASITNA